MTNLLWKSWFEMLNILMGSAAPNRAPVTGEHNAAAADNPVADVLELWGIGMKQYVRAAEPWAELTKQYLGFSPNVPGGADPFAGIFERSFGLLLNFPGLEQELPSLMRETAGTWASLGRALSVYNLVMLPAWMRTGEEILRELQRQAEAGQPVDSVGRLLTVATSVTDRVLVETFRSDGYVEAHHALLNAIAAQRLNQNKIVDVAARNGHFPTRRELDEALREIAELRRELRTLQRSLRGTSHSGASQNGEKLHEASSASAPAESDL